MPHLQHAEPYGTGCPSPPFPARRASQACHRSLREERPRQHTGAMLQKVAESNRWTLCRHWGAPQSGRGHEERATSALVFASDMVHTGGCGREAKASGQEAREPPTQRQSPHEESEGAEESERGLRHEAA